MPNNYARWINLKLQFRLQFEIAISKLVLFQKISQVRGMIVEKCQLLNWKSTLEISSSIHLYDFFFISIDFLLVSFEMIFIKKENFSQAIVDDFQASENKLMKHIVFF